MLWLWMAKWMFGWANLFCWGIRLRRTQMGTWLFDGVEYNELPVPMKLIKTMNMRWATKLRDHGNIRINHLDYFREWENQVLGDNDEGNGRFMFGGHEINTGTANEVYAWCTSMPSIMPERLHEFARHSGYDCLLVIHDPKTFFERIQSCLYADSRYRKFRLQCGQVKYNKRDAVTKTCLNAQKFHFNIFQKDDRFSADREYRVSLIDCGFTRKRNNHTDSGVRDTDAVNIIEISLGDCTKLVTIEALPPVPLETK